MALGSSLPVSETLGVFVGVAGYDWLTEGQAEPLKAIAAAITAGVVIAAARQYLKHRSKH